MPGDSRMKNSGETPPTGKSLSPAADYALEFASIRERFEQTGEGGAVLLERSALVDAVVAGLYCELLSPAPDEPKNFCVAALGGYDRRELFPYSDVDLLFLSANGGAEASRKEAVATMTRTLWDLGLRVSQTVRTLAECGQLHRDNPEFNLALLDSRYLAGDPWLFTRLRADAVPHLVGRDRHDLVRHLAEMTQARHAKHGHTVFHLEPNVKEAPGGLRDFHVARWLTLIVELEKQGTWVAPEALWPPTLAAEGLRAFEFLAATRCFIHYRQGRDDNLLTYELQDLAAARGIGQRPGQQVPPAHWMRQYFRHARAIERLTRRLLDEIAPARSSLYSLFQDWRSRLSNPDFLVVRGRIFPRQPERLDDLNLLLGLFEMMARHALEPSREAERWIEEAVTRMPENARQAPDLWDAFRRALLLPHAAEALRAMHRLGLLSALFPEFRAIDCHVVRDFFHRYTVDEHSLMTIESLHTLRPPRRGKESGRAGDALEGWERNFAEILGELEQPELLLFALLFHDVGKGMPVENHIAGSLQAVEAVAERLQLRPEERETIRFLIAHHLDMSATLQRRDIFDRETVRACAENVGSPERLKMLTLLTYADIKAVNPEALTAWKAEMLWRLYAATANYLTRSVDEERVRAADATGKAEAARKLLGNSATAEELNAFLAGLPRRYLETQTPEEIVGHFRLAGELAESPVRVSLRRRGRLYELTVLTADRPFLFASISGTLAAWGMNILKAEAFANAAGIIVDTFRFEDLFRTLELNPSEADRLPQSVIDVLTGKADLQALMSGRVNPATLRRPKVNVPTRIYFDDISSSHSTLLELVTQDRPGLLYDASSTLSESGCNIEVALIDTEGQKVIDVFYLTYAGGKLDAARQAALREALERRLGERASSTAAG